MSTWFPYGMSTVLQPGGCFLWPVSEGGGRRFRNRLVDSAVMAVKQQQ